ncbi:hypothetical protein SAMN05192553_10577 [Cyclobacterium xiamenense]|uniref:Uncharacterized protein n=1 Tax=Cyclobacterium xiamenense TaxID=1297121 RepID=A0A1H7A203_9BACT|nr:hypothetical protein SAMN05192553_10577 [Cyclobacterium xiamenense]
MDTMCRTNTSPKNAFREKDAYSEKSRCGMQSGFSLLVAGLYRRTRQGCRYRCYRDFPGGTDFAPHAGD